MVVVGMALTLALTGCGGGDTAQSTSQTVSTESTAAEPAGKIGGTVTGDSTVDFYGPGTSTEDGATLELTQGHRDLSISTRDMDGGADYAVYVDGEQIETEPIVDVDKSIMLPELAVGDHNLEVIGTKDGQTVLYRLFVINVR